MNIDIDMCEFAVETARFDKFERAFDFLTEMYDSESKDSVNSLIKCQHINAAREALTQSMIESVANLRKIKGEREEALDAHFSDEYSKLIPF